MEKRTLVWKKHVQLGAQMAAYAGWEMPIRYSDIQTEHMAVRTAAGLFDVSHMGELSLTGAGALAFANFLVTNAVALPDTMRATYSPMCYPDGGTVDDLFLYTISPEHVLMVVNAANIQKDEEFIRAILPEGIQLTNESDEWIQFAIQGPKAQDVLNRLPFMSGVDVRRMAFMTWNRFLTEGYETIISRSGYTGGDGYELYVRCFGDEEFAVCLWDQLLAAGQSDGLIPAGLGARDTLRLEGALPLYGHELLVDISPIEAGLSRFVRIDKGDFSGSDALRLQRENGTQRVRVGLVLHDKGIARDGCDVFSEEGERIGLTTSGGVGVFIGQNIAMALVQRSYSTVGQTVFVEVRGRRLRAEVVSMPFYHKAK